MKRKKEAPSSMAILGISFKSSYNISVKNQHILVFPFVLLILTHFMIATIRCISFSGIPAAFGDLDLNKRTDIVVIGDDGSRIDIYYQHQRQLLSQLELGFSCKSDKQVVQVYLADIDSDGNPNLLPLVLEGKDGKDKLYRLKSLKVRSIEQPPYATKLNSNAAYSLALNSESTNSSGNATLIESLALKHEPPHCEFTDLDVEMKAQPLLFDLDGDLRTDLMSLDKSGYVSVWRPPTSGSQTEKFEKVVDTKWNSIKREYFLEPHSNAFIDISNDSSADIVLSSGGNIAYLFADSDPQKSFTKSKEFNFDDKTYEYGQSALVDINADGIIDHIIPRCHRSSGKCDIRCLYNNGYNETIFKFDNYTSGANAYYDYRLNANLFSREYLFPITLRASDLDGDGYTDFVAVAKDVRESKSKVIYLRNIPLPEKTKSEQPVEEPLGSRVMTRTFEVHEVSTDQGTKDIQLVTLFDINEDGKVDMLVGASEYNNRPSDLNISAIMNNQMVDACFMKVLVTNGFYSAEAGSNGQSARGPFICFELSQNDGKKMQGCAGQLAQSSHFALQQPYVIFGLGQTPHFVETLLVSIPGFGPDKRVRTRLLEQIVPDAQVIIIPKQKDNPNSWDYKMFLSPMSDLVFSTLIALAVLCLIILFIIFILHRQETIEDAAEHEEYKRHWPESR